jgi:hypothetical protein
MATVITGRASSILEPTLTTDSKILFPSESLEMLKQRIENLEAIAVSGAS